MLNCLFLMCQTLILAGEDRQSEANLTNTYITSSVSCHGGYGDSKEKVHEG